MSLNINSDRTQYSNGFVVTVSSFQLLPQGSMHELAIRNPDPTSNIAGVAARRFVSHKPDKEANFSEICLLPVSFSNYSKDLKECGIKDQGWLNRIFFPDSKSTACLHTDLVPNIYKPDVRIMPVLLERLDKLLAKNNTRIGQLIVPAVTDWIFGREVNLKPLDLSLSKINWLFKNDIPGFRTEFEEKQGRWGRW